MIKIYFLKVLLTSSGNHVNSHGIQLVTFFNRHYFIIAHFILKGVSESLRSDNL